MNITSCPNCGGRIRSETIGWKCEQCRGFIDMRGTFHPKKDNPFMPPQTNADRIRSMTDEELAEWIWQAQKEAVQYVVTQLGYPDKLDFPLDCVQYLIDWLKQPVEEDAE